MNILVNIIVYIFFTSVVILSYKWMRKDKGYEPIIAFISSLAGLIIFLFNWFSDAKSTQIDIKYIKESSQIPVFESDITTNGKMKYIKWNTQLKIFNESEKDIKIENITYKNVSKKYSLISSIKPNITLPFEQERRLNYPIQIKSHSSMDVSVTFLIESRDLKSDTIIEYKAYQYDSLNKSLYLMWNGSKSTDNKSVFVNFKLGVLFREEDSKIVEQWIDFKENLVFIGNEADDGGNFASYNIAKNQMIGKRTTENPVISIIQGYGEQSRDFIKYTFDDLQAFVIYNPENFSGVLALFSRYFRDGDLDKAKELLEKYSPDDDFETAIVKNNLGAVEIERRNLAKGVGLIKEAILKDKCLGNAYMNLFELYFWQKNFKESRTVARNYIINCNEDFDYWAFLLFCQMKESEDLKFDIKCFEKAQELNPSDGNFAYFSGMGYYLLDQYKKASVATKRAMELGVRPEFELPVKNNLGSCYLELNNFVDAEPIFREIVKNNPNYWHGHYNLGFSLFKQKKFLEAIVEYQKCIQIDPKNKKAYLELVDLYYETNDEANAKLFQSKYRAIK
jgi:tetratricopeptide (TPR) repeat protein